MIRSYLPNCFDPLPQIFRLHAVFDLRKALAERASFLEEQLEGLEEIEQFQISFGAIPRQLYAHLHIFSKV